MSARVWAILATLLATALLAAGCGGDEGGDTTTTVVEETGGDSGGGDGGGEPVIESNGAAFDAQAVFERAAPGVVTVSSIFAGGSDPLGTGPQAGQGSGFVISDEGEIVTNAHVVTDGETGGGEINAAREVFVEFPDRNTVEAEIVGFDPFADVALIKVDPEDLDIEPVELGEIEDLEVGDPVAAIGSPFGELQSLSVGVVSQTDRTIPSLTRFSIDGAIQTDASINPGNSGGPLLDSQGRVVGINQQIDTTSGGNQGVGFAVPIDLASRSIDQLREDGTVDYAYIGVETQPLYPQLAEELDIDSPTGALVATVVEGGPADEAGLCCALTEDEQNEKSIRFQATEVVPGGDVIVAVDGEEIVGVADLPRIISRRDPGDEVTLEIIRDGERMDLTIELGTRPEPAS